MEQNYFQKRRNHEESDEEEHFQNKLQNLNAFSMDLGNVINEQNRKIERNSSSIKDMVNTMKRKLWNVETQKYSLFGAFLALLILFFIITRF